MSEATAKKLESGPHDFRITKTAQDGIVLVYEQRLSKKGKLFCYTISVDKDGQRVELPKVPLDYYTNLSKLKEIAEAGGIRNKKFNEELREDLSTLFFTTITMPQPQKPEEQEHKVACYIGSNWYADACLVDGKPYFVVIRQHTPSELKEKLTVENGKVITPLVPNDTRLLKLPRLQWPLPQKPDVKLLYEQIKAKIRTLWDPTNEYSHTLFTLWLFSTYRSDIIGVAPYLRLKGPYGSGKTRALNILGSLSLRPLNVGPALTQAAVFRLCELYKPTACLNEFSTSSKENADYASMAISLLNSRFERGHPIPRCNMDDPSVLEVFDPFGPTCFTARTSFTDSSLESRCLDIDCTETEDASIPSIVSPEMFERELGELRDQLFLALRIYGNGEEKPDFATGEVPGRFKQLLLALYKALPTELDGEFATLLAHLKESEQYKYAVSDEGVLWTGIYERASEVMNKGSEFALTGELAAEILSIKDKDGKLNPRSGGKRLSAIGFKEAGRIGNKHSWVCSKKLWEKNARRLGMVPPAWPWEEQITLRGETV